MNNLWVQAFIFDIMIYCQFQTIEVIRDVKFEQLKSNFVCLSIFGQSYAPHCWLLFWPIVHRSRPLTTSRSNFSSVLHCVTCWFLQCWPGPKRSKVLTGTYTNNPKQSLQIAGPKTFNAILITTSHWETLSENPQTIREDL